MRSVALVFVALILNGVTSVEAQNGQSVKSRSKTMRRGNGSEGSHSDSGTLARGKGDGVADRGVDDRPEGVELKVGVMGVPAAEEARESWEEEVGKDSFRDMAIVVAVVKTRVLVLQREEREEVRTIGGAAKRGYTSTDPTR